MIIIAKLTELIKNGEKADIKEELITYVALGD